ncbi:probable Mitochondrial distribution and morphology protein 10 [Zygosaccharomyces bailii]|nr:probable Mitochondrial distribution and morphology protein 10 [Zygosaccharomyces bailii]
MLDYMDYVIRQFEKSTNWNYDNSYANITASSRHVLDFPVPNQFKFQISNKSTPYTFNTMEIFTKKIFNGSMTYLYTDADNMDIFVQNSNSTTLQDVTETYRYVQPYHSHAHASSLNHMKSLYYGRMSYPCPNLEAMLIKRLNETTQLTLKCVSSFNGFNILTGYWQHDTGKNRHEIIMSTNDLLCGYRFLHNFVGTPSKFKTSLYDNSSLSFGAELWLGIITLSPGCSTTLRYCTHSPNTGRPLTLTLTWNPLFGHISSTYTAKTSSSSTFSTKYDFNLYSIDSNLSFGCEFWRSGSEEKPYEGDNHQGDSKMYHHMMTSEKDLKAFSNSVPDKNPIADSQQEKQLLDDLTIAFSSSLKKVDKEKSVIKKFENKVSDSTFSSVWKLSTSLRDKNLRVLWEGKFKGFLLSAGADFCNNDPKAELTELQTDEKKLSIYPKKFGVQLQYST